MAASGEPNTSAQMDSTESGNDSLLVIPSFSTPEKYMGVSALSYKFADDALPSCCFCMGPLLDCSEQTKWDGTPENIAANCSTVRLRGETIGSVHAVCMVKHVVENDTGKLCPTCGYKHYAEGDFQTRILLDQRAHEACYNQLQNMREDELAAWMMSKLTDKTLGDWIARPRHALAQRESDEVLQMRADLAARPQIPVPQTEVFIEESDESEED